MTQADWLHIGKIGGLFCLAAGGWLMFLLRLWPRIFLRHFPEDVRATVPPLSARERRLGMLVALPFFVMLLAFPVWAAVGVAANHAGGASFVDSFLAAFAAWMMFNLFDWWVLDEFCIGVLRPRWLVLRGAEHIPMRFDHREHAVGFLKGTIGGSVIAAVTAGVLLFIK